MTLSRTFECVDCDLTVVSIAPPHNPDRRCAGCQWLADLPPAADTAELRAHMVSLGGIGERPIPRTADRRGD